MKQTLSDQWKPRMRGFCVQIVLKVFHTIIEKEAIKPMISYLLHLMKSGVSTITNWRAKPLG